MNKHVINQTLHHHKINNNDVCAHYCYDKNNTYFYIKNNNCYCLKSKPSKRKNINFNNKKNSNIYDINVKTNIVKKIKLNNIKINLKDVLISDNIVMKEDKDFKITINRNIISKKLSKKKINKIQLFMKNSFEGLIQLKNHNNNHQKDNKKMTFKLIEPIQIKPDYNSRQFYTSPV